ncbi:MAG: peptidylprolyl isomerase [Gemmatimonadetes bacterium]|nr:peptidylprolyl isomerase [Gemmatimonadota bacterium]MDA1104619.1 peptidylprolyl isomerase [Gemmatimonadota bacterium]
MMRQMREATKPIMLFTAIAFVALMVFQWGMDITGQSGGGLGEIGSVNGDAVMYESYMAAYRQLYDQVQRGQEELISSQQNTEIEDAAFDEVVNQLLIMQELDRRGITVTNREISEAAQFNPPDYLRPQFANEAGGVDLAAYQSFLYSLPPEQLLILEAYYRDVIPRGKLLRQVSSGIYLSDSQLWQQYRDQNEQVEIRYVPMNPASRYQDDMFTISDADIAAYYGANQDEFEISARATVKVVVLDKTPTAADTVAAQERAAGLRQEIAGGVDFAEVAGRESSDASSAAVGGDLGVFPKNYMTPPFDSAVFAAPIGRLVGPLKTSFGYHLIEVQNRWATDSVQARHVLIPVVRTEDSEIALLTMADSIEDLGEAMPLDQAAATAGLSATTIEIAQNFPFVAGAGQVSEGADWIFEEASPGDVSPVFETSTAFYALEVVSSEPDGVLSLVDATPSIRSTLLFDRKMERAALDAQDVVTRVRGGAALANVAADLGLEARNAGPLSRNDFVPGVGRQNAAIGAAFGLRPGEVSGVVVTPANAYVLELLDRTAADSTAWLAQIPQQREAAVLRLQQQRLQEWIAALRSAARIVDRRDIVLAPVDEDQIQMPMVF